MKPTYDVINVARGLTNMYHGYLEEVHAKVYGSAHPFPHDEYAIIETPSCFLRVKSSSLNSESVTQYLKSYFAIYRVNPSPRYASCVQWSSKPGRWVNGESFDTPEDARIFVANQNARLIPFAESPYLVQPIADEY